MKENRIEKMSISRYLARHKWPLIALALLFIIGGIGDTVSTIFIANSVGEITVGNFLGGTRLIIYSLVLRVIIRAFYFTGNFLFFKYSNLICSEISVDVTKRCFELSSSTFHENNSGSFVQKILDEPRNILTNLFDIVQNLTEIISSAIAAGYLIFLNWIIGLIYIFIILVTFLLEQKRQSVRRKNRWKNKKINDKTYSLFYEIVSSEKDIKALNMSGRLCDNANQQVADLKSSNYKVQMTDCVFWSSRNFIIEITNLLILLLAIFMMQKNIITLATYVLVFSYKNGIYSLIWQLGTVKQNITEIQIEHKRIFELFDDEKFKPEVYGKKVLKNIRGDIEFKNVKFSYIDREKNEKIDLDIKKRKKKNKTEEEKPKFSEKKVFENLSFIIPANKTVAFVGKSGSGKSTILSLISKLNDAQSGHVKIDGYDIKTLSKETIRENIAMINQFPYMFDMSVKDNLLLVKKDATDEELWKVLRDAYFDEDVKALPHGIDTKIGETGVKLSGGQRQRLAIARALLKQSKIILFDESTSSLDNFAQSYIQKSIDKIKGNHTIVIVAHRLSTIKNADIIFYLDEGNVVDSGTFEELFNNNEKFQSMFLIENI